MRRPAIARTGKDLHPAETGSEAGSGNTARTPEKAGDWMERTEGGWERRNLVIPEIRVKMT